MRLTRRIALFPLVLLLAACASRQDPDEPGRRLEDGEGTWAETHDVRVEARPDAWDGRPDALADQVTPLLVTIENDGERPLRLRYKEMALIAPDAQRFSALPPFNVHGQVYRSVRDPVWPPEGFFVAPQLSAFYPGLPPWDGAFDFDPFYYDTYNPRLAELGLPSEDMLQRSLPEGVLAPGGRVQGFVYFEPVPDVASARLHIDLVDAASGEPVGRLALPVTGG